MGGEDTKGENTKRSTSPSFIRNKPSFPENDLGFLDSVKFANFQGENSAVLGTSEAKEDMNITASF